MFCVCYLNYIFSHKLLNLVTFRNLFIKVYIASVFKKIEPHGQVENDMEMDRVLLAQSNSSKKAVVKSGQAVVKYRSPIATGLCFQTREEFRGHS